MDERKIIRLLKNGRREYCEPLIEKYEQQLYRYCFHLSRNAQDAMDLFQDTWLKAISKIETYNENYSFKNWLLAIASNAFKDSYRKKMRKNRIFKDFSNQDVMDREMATVPSVQRAADEFLVESEIQAKLKREVNRLKWPYKTVIVLHYFEEIPVKDIGIILEIPVGTVKSRLSTARGILKGRMEIAI